MNSERNLAREFTSVVSGRNFMTPNFVGYRAIPDGVVEISTGRGMSGSAIFGVTVVKGGVHRHDLSGMYFSRAAAFARVRELAEESTNE